VVANRYPRALPNADTIDGVPVRRWLFLRPSWAQVRRRRPDLLLASLYYYPSVLRRLSGMVQALRPDVLNVHFPDAQIPFVLALRRRFSFRLVVSLHGDDVKRFRSGDPAWLGALLREADAVTACSPHLLDEAARLEPAVAGKGTAIANGIDPVRFKDKTAHHHPSPYILALGRLTHKKGFDMLLTALAQTWPSCPSVDLILAGAGEEQAALKAQARQLGLAKRVHFHGCASPAEVVRLLNGCQFLVVPSRAEPFGIVALEGLAAGKPVLATDVGGMGQFLGELRCVDGLFGTHAAHPAVSLVAPTEEGLAEGLRKRLHAASAGEALADTTSRFVLDEYSWARVAERYQQVFAGN
jgi:glycosyltransferase involved in cell wall biosynthesis